MSQIKIHNIETGEIIEREMTAEELFQLEKDNKEAEARAAEIAKKAAEKAALLEKLGITEEEAKLLLA
jgi:hypothetical protein